MPYTPYGPDQDEWTKTLTKLQVGSITEYFLRVNQSVQEAAPPGLANDIKDEFVGKLGPHVEPYDPEGKFRFIQEF